MTFRVYLAPTELWVVLEKCIVFYDGLDWRPRFGLRVRVPGTKPISKIVKNAFSRHYTTTVFRWTFPRNLRGKVYECRFGGRRFRVFTRCPPFFFSFECVCGRPTGPFKTDSKSLRLSVLKHRIERESIINVVFSETIYNTRPPWAKYEYNNILAWRRRWWRWRDNDNNSLWDIVFEIDRFRRQRGSSRERLTRGKTRIYRLWIMKSLFNTGFWYYRVEIFPSFPRISPGDRNFPYRNATQCAQQLLLAVFSFF